MARREFPGRRAPTSDPDWLTLGQALHDNPRPGGVQTTLRTLPPLTETGG